jgi:general secretion pathway protein G
MILTRHAVARGTRDTTRAGFTLMEVLVVAAILVILAGTGTIILFRYLEDARVDAAKVRIKNVETALEGYKMSHGSYPGDLTALTVSEGGRGAYLETNGLLDPWEHEFVYEPQNLNPQTRKPRVYSQGPNPGDASSIIANW